MPAIRLATFADAGALQPLIQRAYRGPESRAGWTHEADLLDGERVSVAELEALLADPAERFLIAEADGRLVGCVRVADLGGGLAYLGMLAVDPVRQAGGVGKALIAAAESLAHDEFGASHIEMTVIDTRVELIAYYRRRGYLAGEARPFPFAVDRPIAMIAMTKPLGDA